MTKKIGTPAKENEIKRIAELFSKKESKGGKIGIADKVIGFMIDNDTVYEDCPDGYFYDAENKELYIFEHFQIDAAKKTKKGSALSNKQAEASREFFKSIKKAGDEVTFDFTTQSGEKIEFLVENFEKSYLKHYNNIELYKKNIFGKLQLNASEIGVKVCFIVEQLFSFSLIGQRYDAPKNLIGIPFPSIKEIIDVVINSPVDYLLTIVNSPITEGQVGFRKKQFPDGWPIFVIDDPRVWRPMVNFYTKEDLKVHKYLFPTVNDLRREILFMEGKQYYKVKAYEKK